MGKEQCKLAAQRIYEHSCHILSLQRRHNLRRIPPMSTLPIPGVKMPTLGPFDISKLA
jgi:hypothetical protein